MINILAFLPASIVVTSIFSILLVLLYSSIKKSSSNRTIIGGIVYILFIGIFFLCRAILFSYSPEMIETHEAFILQIDRFVRGSLLLVFMSAIFFIRSYFRQKNNVIALLVSVIIAFSMFIITTATSEILISPVTSTGYYFMARATDNKNIMSILYFIVSFSLIFIIFLEFYSIQRKNNSSYLVLSLGHMIFLICLFIEIIQIWTAYGKEQLTGLIVLDIGAFFFILSITYSLMRYSAIESKH